MAFTEAQTRAIGITQRTAGVVSLLLIFFVLFTYMFYRQSFNKSINRLIFYATWSNIGTTVASLIAQEGVVAGDNSALCQFQGFSISMFFLVDTLWAACMALNVYLVIFRDWDVKQLRSLDWVYLLLCYGVAFVPAFTFLFIKTSSRGPIYGGAGIWCWIVNEWSFLRIAASYGPIWVALTFSFIIYSMAAVEIYKKYDQLKGLLNPFRASPFEVVTEVSISHEANSDSIDKPADLVEIDSRFYRVDIDAAPVAKDPGVYNVRSITRSVAQSEVNVEGWLYARIAFLFCLAMLITWVPSSIYRVFNLADPNYVNFGMSYVAALGLSLHGFWNGVVYIVSSQRAVNQLMMKIFYRHSPEAKSGMVINRES